MLAACLLACATAWSIPQGREPVGDSASGSSAPEGRNEKPPAPVVKSHGSEPENTQVHSFRRDIREMGKDLLYTQKQIWTSPSEFRVADTQWLVPIAGVTAGLIQTDGSYNGHLSHNPTTLSHYNTLSNAGVAALAGGAGGMYLLSLHTHNDKWRETGLLSAQAALNSLLFVEASKYVASRDRPMQGNGRGLFFQPSGSSFPSAHAAVAWSVAGVIAHEYPGPLTKIVAYGLATMITYSRVHAQQHFPSDVFIGGIAGEMIGQNVYANFHDTELGGITWKSFHDSFSGESARQPGNQGSPYVPLDSWIYPLFERLNALGYLRNASLGVRPWTRLECARLLNEAAGQIEQSGDESRSTDQLMQALQREFAQDVELLGGGENRSAHFESAYTRFTNISGQPLTDSYHFGETLTDDFGRPYESGVNNVTGFSGWATAGRWVFYSRGEYQYAPSGPAYSTDVRNFIAGADQNPIQPANPTPETSHFQVLDAYAGLNFDNWQLTFGQQSLSWGPTRTGSFLVSDNAVPVRMIQLNRTTPFYLPWIFRYMGAIRIDLFFGNIEGNQFPPNPFFHGEKISLMPLPNLEVGFTRTVILGGEGEPLTLGRVVNSYISTTARGSGQSIATDPGKRTGGLDVSYTVSFRRLPMTFYLDSIADDNTSPLADFRRAGMNPGIYFPKLPGLPHLDLRMEASYTDVPYTIQPGFFIYWDHIYHDLYTNEGQLMGNPVGRDGKSYQAWSRYWLGPRSNLEFSYRHMQVSPSFLPGGGNLNDASVSTSFWFRRVWNVSASVQYEKWNYPLLAAGPQVNITSTVGITFMPTGGRVAP
jgi:membrane-associated phospholipid phosphatase